MKRIVSLLLALAMLLSMPCAMAEDYVPGELANSLMTQAFEGGKRISYAMTELAVRPNAEMMGITQEQADAIAQMIASMDIGFGVVKLEDGIRLDGALEMSGQRVDAILDLTLDGISLRSDALMPGEQFTADWQSLLTLAGVDAASAAQADALLHADWAQLMPQLIEQAQQMMALIAQQAQPYLETALQFVTQIEPTVNTEVAQLAGSPQAATELVYTITDKDVGDLLLALVDVLEQDAVTLPLLTQGISMLAEQQLTGEEVVALLRQAIGASFTDEQYPYVVTLGLDAAGNILYAHEIKQLSEGEILWMYVGLTDEADTVRVGMGVADAASGATSGGFDIKITGRQEQDGGVYAHLGFAVYGNAQIEAAFEVTSAPYTTADSLPGVKLTGSMSMTAPDMRMIMSFDEDAYLTPEGGERDTANVTMDMSVQGVNMPMRVTVDRRITPAEGGHFTADIVEQMDMSAAGFDQYDMAFTIASQDYIEPEPADAVIALSSATQEELTALMTRVQSNAEAIFGAIEASVEALDGAGE